MFLLISDLGALDLCSLCFGVIDWDAFAGTAFFLGLICVKGRFLLLFWGFANHHLPWKDLVFFFVCILLVFFLSQILFIWIDEILGGSFKEKRHVVVQRSDALVQVESILCQVKLT